MSPDSFIAKYSAKIKTPLKGSNNNKVGSGLPISNKYLITSKHVLEDCGTISVVETKIFFPGLDGESQFSIKDYYAFENSEIAFVELEEELPFEECPLFFCEKFTPDLKKQNWVGAGFPEYSSDFEQEMETIKGDLILLPEDQSKIQLSLSLSPKQAEKWSGVSGASVIVGNLILGTIDAVYTEVDRKAEFNSLPYLFSSKKENSKFKDFYGKIFLPSFSNDITPEEHEVVDKIISYNASKILKKYPRFTKLLQEVDGLEDKRDTAAICDFISVSWSTSRALAELHEILEDAIAGPATEIEIEGWVSAGFSIGVLFLLKSLKQNWRSLCSFSRLISSNSFLQLAHTPFVEVIFAYELKRIPGYERVGDEILPSRDFANKFDVYDAAHEKENELSVLKYIYKHFYGENSSVADGLTDSALVSGIVKYVTDYVGLKNDARKFSSKETPPHIIYFVLDERSVRPGEEELLSELANQLKGKLLFLSLQSGGVNLTEGGDESLLNKLLIIDSLRERRGAR